MGLISRVSSRTYRSTMFPRALAYRGITTSATRSSMITHYPKYSMLQNTTDFHEMVSHPNYNPEYVENPHKPFPLAPLMRDLDPQLNKVREMQDGDWSKMSVDDVRKLYFGTFRGYFWTAYTQSDRQTGAYCCMFIYYGIRCILSSISTVGLWS